MKDFLAFIGITIVAAALYVLTIKGVPGNVTGSMIKNNLDQVTKPLELSPERGRYIQTVSLAEDKSFALNKELSDAAYPDVGYYGGRLYVFFAPGISLMALPFYEVGKMFNLSQVFSFSMISIFAVLNLLMIFRITRKIFGLSLPVSLFSAFVFGFGSISWSYAVTMYQHHVSIFLILTSFYAVWKFRQKSKWSFLYTMYVWFAYAWGIWLDSPNAILLFPVMVFFLISSIDISKQKERLKFSFRTISAVTSIVFFIVIGVFGFYNYKNFGNWKRLNGSIVGYKYILEAQKKGKSIVKEYDPNLVVKFFEEDRMPGGMNILFFSLDRSLFLYSPIFILGFWGIVEALRKNSIEKSVLFSIVLTHLFLYSSWGDPWGGWAFGPRYLIPSMSILSIFIGIWLQKYGKKFWSIPLAFILFAYSSAVALLGVLTTNAVPPKVEADYLKIGFNYLYNYRYFVEGRSSSFIFNKFFNGATELQTYYLCIWGTLLVICLVLLFAEKFSKKK